MTNDTQHPGEFSRGWPLVMAALFGIACSISAVPFYSFGTFIGPLQDEFGWSRGDIQTGLGIQTFVAAILGIGVGFAVDRFGSRPIALISLLGLGIALALLSQMGAAIWTFYGILVLLSLLSAGSSPVTWSRAIVNAFHERRGLALGIALTGTGLSGALVPRYAAWAIGEFGWRGGYIALAALPLLIALPLVFLFFRVPKSASTESPADIARAEQAKLGMTLGQAFASPRYWLLILASLLMPIGIAGVISSLVPLLTDSGHSLETAASVAGLIGLSIIFGRLIAGWALDRFWAPAVAAVCLLLPALGCFLLTTVPEALPIAMLAAILVGFGGGAEFDLIAYISARYFGMAHYGKIYGIAFACFAIGAASAHPIFGGVFDATGSYRTAFYIAAGGFIASALLILSMGRYPDLRRMLGDQPAAA